MLMMVGNRSPPLKPNTNGSVDRFEHRKLISINPTSYTPETCCSLPIGVVGLSVLSNILRFSLISSRFAKISSRSGLISSRSAKISLRSSQIRKKIDKFWHKRIDFCKIQRRFAWSEIDRDPTRNRRHLTTRTVFIYQSAMGLGMGDPK